MSAVDSCARKQWFAFHDLEETHPPEGRQARTLDFGHYIETATVSWLKDSGYKVYAPITQIEVASPFSMGHLDGIMEFDGRWMPFDVKGPQTGWSRQRANSHAGFEGWAYSLGLRARDIVDMEVVRAPHANGVRTHEPGYYAQAHQYMKYGPATFGEVPDGVGFGSAIDWRSFLFVVIDKGTQKMILEEIHYDEEYAEELGRREEMLFNLGASEEMPDIPSGYRADGFPCSWAAGAAGCSQRGRCW
jgi:hypothetical protein